MKALTLYIDKWYIIGAVCTDGVPRLITPTNHEDRFWLYFYEDTYNNSIVYGKDNQSHYRNGEAHYIGDVFSLITDPDRRFSRYNGKGEEMKMIFQASGIFDLLRSAVDTDGEIETYISFSPDIPGPSRLVFFEELKSNSFNVIGSQARIGFLALEHNRRHDSLLEEGYYLVLNACNENLHYILYKRENNKYKMFSENVLVGMGMDLRGRALVESIVDSINNRTHFLATKEEVEKEYLRMEQFVPKWFVKIANAKPFIPITIPNVSFGNQPANTYQVSIIKNKLDERTSVIVNNIIKVVADFTRTAGVRNDEIKGLVFIGNTFTNSQFERAIREKFYVSEENVIRHKESDLPNIVGVYPLLEDLHESDWQKTAEKDLGEIQKRAAFDKEKETLENLIKTRSWDEARTHLDKMSNFYLDYSSELSGYKTIIDRGIIEDGNKSARLYDEAMQKVYSFEKSQDYAQMRDWADIALKHRPEDKEAHQKKAEAERLLSDQKVREEQYRTIISRAQTSLREGRWQDAISQSEAALNLRPSSVEAKRIYNEAKKHIEAAKEIDKFINRADVFFAQKLYDEALRELAKVQSLDSDNVEAAQRIKEIEDICKEHTLKLTSLVKRYEEAKTTRNYDKAIEICEQITEIDTINQRKWSAETEKLKADRDKALETQKRFEDLKNKAMGAYFNEDWKSVIHYASEAIAIQSNEDLSKIIERAKQKISIQEKDIEYQREINRVNALLSSGDVDEANIILNRLQKEYPEHIKEIKGLRKRAFAWGNPTPSKKENPQRPPIGFNAPQTKTKPKDAGSFFEDDTPPKKPNVPASKPKPSQPKEKPPKKTGIDFFDMDFNPKT